MRRFNLNQFVDSIGLERELGRNLTFGAEIIGRGEKEGVKIDKAQAGSIYRREQSLRRELLLFLWFSSFGECLRVINVEAHSTHWRMARIIIIAIGRKNGVDAKDNVHIKTTHTYIYT